MYFTLSVKDVALILLLLALIIFVVYLIQFFRNLIVSVKKSNEILDDVKVMTEIAEKRSRDLDEMIDNVSGSVESIAKAVKGQETLLKQLSSIASAVSTIVGMFGGKKDE